MHRWEPPRRRQSMGGGDERQELHHSNLAFGNACSVCLAQRLSTARPPFAARAGAATVCARPERRTSTDRVGSAKTTVFKRGLRTFTSAAPLGTEHGARRDKLCQSSSALRGFLRRRARRPESSHQSIDCALAAESSCGSYGSRKTGFSQPKLRSAPLRGLSPVSRARETKIHHPHVAAASHRRKPWAWSRFVTHLSQTLKLSCRR